ncbi:MAG: Rne/Rng family ribonuclease, partial [Psychrobacter sp.]
ADNIKQQAASGNNGSKNQANTRRNQNPNEVVLQVNEAPAALKPSEVVHLSLDDSKSTQTKSQATEKQSSTDEVAKDKVAKASNTQAQSNHRNTNKKVTDDKVAAEKATANNAVEISEDKVDSTAKDDSQNNTVKANANTDVKEPVAGEPSVSKSDKDSASDDTVKPVVAQANSTPVADKHQEANTKGDDEDDNAQKADNSVKSSNDSDNTKSKSALDLTHEALFATRYVTAEKFGKASNDPRVVLSQQAQSQVMPEPKVNEQAVASIPAIHGTVGEFIRATLPEAQTRLTADGVINCFIETVALHIEQAQRADSDANVSANNGSELASQSFDFSNYGYQPLTADYLSRFEMMTQAVNQFAAAPGKTDVEPRTVSKRASNDPRGQHPDYQQPAVLDAHQVEATALSNQDQTDDISADSKQLLATDKALSEVDSQQPDVESATENVDAKNAAEATADTAIEQALESKVEEPTKEEIQAEKSKTTIASYKNMIENVAEQLLPQTGMFNLTTPKVPKARTRKPKADHKKPT